MQQLLRSILGPFASAAAGAIMSIFVAIFVFGIKNETTLNGFALAGALLGVAPELLPIVALIIRWRESLRSKAQKKVASASIANDVSTLDMQRIQKSAEAEEAQRKLDEEHEARRPICTHCHEKTEPVFRHQKLNGSPDMRYRDNPLLCNKCFQP